MTKNVQRKDWREIFTAWRDGSHRPFLQPAALLGSQPGSRISYFDTAIPFRNLVKQGGHGGTAYNNCAWSTATATNVNTGEMQYLPVDANGYPTSLTATDIGNGAPPGTQTFDRVFMWLHDSQPALAPNQTDFFYAGDHRLKFIGLGTMVVVVDGSVVLTLANPDANTYAEGTFTVPSAAASLGIYISAVNSDTDNPRDVSVVHTDLVAGYDAGDTLHPDWLAVNANCTTFRGMQWLNQDNQNVFIASQTYTEGATSVPIPAWTYASGEYPLWLKDGQSFTATIEYGATTATLSSAIGTTVTTAAVIVAPSPLWADRVPVGYVSYGTARGCPIEIVLEAANALGCDAFVTVPWGADDAYFTGVATLIDETLAAGKKCTVEFSNEVWNTTFTQYHLSVSAGRHQWPSASGDLIANRNWHGMRTAVMSELIFATLGADKVPSRVVPSLGIASDNTAYLTEGMDTTLWTDSIDGFTGPASSHKIAAVNCNWYWGFRPGNAHFSDTDATAMFAASVPIDDLFACMQDNVGTTDNGSVSYTSVPAGGWEGKLKTDLAAIKVLADGYSVPVIGYEGGPNTVPVDSPAGMAAVINAAHRDARMGESISRILAWWDSNMGATNEKVFFCNVAPLTTGSDCFGSLESQMQPYSPLTAAPPKFQALQSYLQS
ncbi:MAG TPA: hypothetical protein VFX20_18205 [Steroidobacteraceae bacterium]|nr:hypothetical protein [Steroidobacteraceae bacterium]